MTLETQMRPGRPSTAWRWIRRLLATLLVLVVTMVVFIGCWMYLSHPKLLVRGPHAPDPAPGVFTFADIPRGRNLSAAEIEQYTSRLLGEMTLEEKTAQMSGDQWYADLVRIVVKQRYNDRAIPSGEVRRLRIPPVMFSDGPRGVLMGESTAFPVAMARAASWDRALVSRVADAIATEVRAQDGNLWGGLCINLLRHPGWGRAQETFGEDPYLLGELAVASVSAVQRHNVMACPKHFALNSVEEVRTEIDVRADERTLREVYLPHFERAVKAGAASVMSSYNKVNGDYAAESRSLLTDVLKRGWGFQGFVMSDFFEGVHDIRKAARAGLDIEMPLAQLARELPALVRSGELPPALVDEAARRVLRTKIRFLTRADPMRYERSMVASPAHVSLAQETAEKSMVLLKNDRALLPFDAAGVRTLAVLGRLADAPNQGDLGSSNVHPPSVVTPLAGLRERLGSSVRVVHEPAADEARVRAAAAGADAVVVVAGLDGADEGEYIPQLGVGGDRRTLGLGNDDVRVIRAAAAANRRTVVVLVGGSAITADEWKGDVDAILMAFYPGMAGGRALARVLFGDVNPSGKLPFTVPADASWLPPFTPGAPSIDYGYYHGYTLAEKGGIEPAFAFGHGLSYTTFRYANLRTEPGEIGGGGTVRASVDVTNTGSRSGEEAVQLYVGFPHATVDRPLKLLRGFDKVALAPGETRTVTFTVPASALAYWDAAAHGWRVEPVEHDVYVGGSSRAADLLKGSFRVTP